MDLFNKKALNRAHRELQDARAEIARLAKRIEQTAAHENTIGEALRTLQTERDELKGQLSEAESARDKALERMGKAEQMAHWLEERASAVKASSDEAQRCRAEAAAARAEAEAAKGEAGRLQQNLDEARAEVSRLQNAVDAAPRPTPVAAPVIERPTAPVGGADVAEMKRSIADLHAQLQVALRKAENNRRAYLITQMQLDLAEDRLSIQQTGKPRPILGLGRQAEVPAGEVAAPEEVVEYPESEDDPVPVVDEEPAGETA